MIGHEAYDAWRSATIEFTKAAAEYSAGDKKAGVRARKLAVAIAGHLKTWRAASIDHDKGVAPAAQPQVDEPAEEQTEEQATNYPVF